MNLKAPLAELFATFTLIFIGGGSIMIDALLRAQGDSGIGLLGIAVAHGLALAIGASATMNVSGAHINPAVTLAFLSIGRINASMAGLYILFQLIGAAIAGYLLLYTFPGAETGANTLGTPALTVPTGAGLVLEAVATALLVFGIYGTAAGSKAPKGLGGFGIGLSVAFLILAIGPLTGAAMNPARHFGTALASQFFDNLWLYWVGPVIGAVLGMQLFSRILEDKRP